jgi:acetyl-CoA carboxylase carboxyltransferase component
MAVMGGSTAAKTLLQIQVSALQKKGKEIDPVEEQKLLKEITDKYNTQLSPYYAAGRLWVDGIIDPVETRHIISTGIETANLNPNVPKYDVGVIQV